MRCMGVFPDRRFMLRREMFLGSRYRIMMQNVSPLSRKSDAHGHEAEHRQRGSRTNMDNSNWRG